jgi:hypothetical protein
MTPLYGPQAVAGAMGELAESARAEVVQLMLLQVPPDVLAHVGYAAAFAKVSFSQCVIAEYARRMVLSPDRAAVARNLR